MAEPTTVESLRARIAEVERERDAAILRHDEDLGRMQRVVYDALCAAVKDALPSEPLSRIDGAGSDGDEFDFTEAEVSIACGLLTDALDEARRERDARPDPRALLRALDAIRSASALGSTPAELARMVEDVQAGLTVPPTGDGALLGDEITRLRAERDELAATLANERGEGEPPVPGWTPVDCDHRRWEHHAQNLACYPVQTREYIVIVRGSLRGELAREKTARAAMRAAAEVKS